MRKHSRGWLILALISVLSVAGFFYFQRASQPTLDPEKYIQSTRPTIFFHGYGSSANAERHMTEAARKAGVTQTIIQATVLKNGEVQLNGEIPKGAINPIIKVEYEDNRNPDPATLTQYAYQAITTLQKKYHFTEMNLVGHSMGNMSILYYLLEHGSDESLPKVSKLVAIANHVAGLEGMNLPEKFSLDPETGEPSAMNAQYQQLTGLLEVFPENQIDVLNIYGDIGGETDGSVKNVSSRALKYLVKNRAKTYREEKISGKGGQHSQLHENPQVDQLLIDFLWQN